VGLGDGYFCEWRFGALKSSWRRMTLEEVGVWERQSGLLPAELGGLSKMNLVRDDRGWIRLVDRRRRRES
jgi:hypothetical protein